MLLVCWNVAGRKTRLQEQADRVLALEPDVVCLQEVTPVTAETWLERLAAAGLDGALAPLPKAREDKLSDHSALVARVALAGTEPR